MFETKGETYAKNLDWQDCVICLLMCTRITYATGDDTDGTELQVAQPVILQIQLGQQWAGTEFQLKTNAGLYPGTITVGQDGILRRELGSSGTYILSCVNSGYRITLR